MDNPKSALELADAVENLIGQMFLAHRMCDESVFMQAHDRAAELCADLVERLDELECKNEVGE